MVFLPTNLEGYDDKLGIEKNECVRYFDQGDAVRVLDGKYKGESGIITSVDTEKVDMPTIKLDTLGLEITINTTNLRMKDLREEDQKNVERKRLDADKRQQNSLDIMKQRSQEHIYKVGDIVCYEGNKVHGYVIKVEHDLLHVVNEFCKMAQLRYSQIDKKIPVNKTRLLRDSKGLPIQLDDPIKVTEKSSQFYECTGIIKNMVRNQLFLWSEKFLNQSNGIFVESCKNVRIQGHDIIAKE